LTCAATRQRLERAVKRSPAYFGGLYCGLRPLSVDVVCEMARRCRPAAAVRSRRGLTLMSRSRPGPRKKKDEIRNLMEFWQITIDALQESGRRHASRGL